MSDANIPQQHHHEDQGHHQQESDVLDGHQSHSANSYLRKHNPARETQKNTQLNLLSWVDAGQSRHHPSIENWQLHSKIDPNLTPE